MTCSETYYLDLASEVGRNISSIFPLNIIFAFMEILQVIFGVSEMILFLMIVVFPHKIIAELVRQEFAEVKCGRFTFELLPIKFLAKFPLIFSFSSIFVE